jgi:DNA-binding MarR family transcriptional regulator
MDEGAGDGTRMRYLTGVLRPVEAMHPVEAAFAEDPAITPVALHESRLHDTGTCITLLQLEGDPEHVRSVLTAHPAIEDFLVAGDRDLFVYLESRPGELTRRLLTAESESAVVAETPFGYTGDGGLRGTLVGSDDALARFVDALPDALTLEVERLGEYHPQTDDLASILTPRQREIVAAAVQRGYYASPRRVSQRELASALGIASGTLSQHLQRIEAKVFPALLPQVTRSAESTRRRSLAGRSFEEGSPDRPRREVDR